MPQEAQSRSHSITRADPLSQSTSASNTNDNSPAHTPLPTLPEGEGVENPLGSFKGASSSSRAVTLPKPADFMTPSVTGGASPDHEPLPASEEAPSTPVRARKVVQAETEAEAEPLADEEMPSLHPSPLKAKSPSPTLKGLPDLEAKRSLMNSLLAKRRSGENHVHPVHPNSHGGGKEQHHVHFASPNRDLNKTSPAVFSTPQPKRLHVSLDDDAMAELSLMPLSLLHAKSLSPSQGMLIARMNAHRRDRSLHSSPVKAPSRTLNSDDDPASQQNSLSSGQIAAAQQQNSLSHNSLPGGSSNALPASALPSSAARALSSQTNSPTQTPGVRAKTRVNLAFTAAWAAASRQVDARSPPSGGGPLGALPMMAHNAPERSMLSHHSILSNPGPDRDRAGRHNSSAESPRPHGVTSDLRPASRGTTTNPGRCKRADLQSHLCLKAACFSQC